MNTLKCWNVHFLARKYPCEFAEIATTKNKWENNLKSSIEFTWINELFHVYKLDKKNAIVPLI